MEMTSVQNKVPQTTQSSNLHAAVKQAVESYFKELQGEPAGNLYELLISEVEKSFFEVLLKQVRGNQSKAAKILGISRGTLRKKLKLLGFIR